MSYLVSEYCTFTVASKSVCAPCLEQDFLCNRAEIHVLAWERYLFQVNSTFPHTPPHCQWALQTNVSVYKFAVSTDNSHHTVVRSVCGVNCFYMYDGLRWNLVHKTTSVVFKSTFRAARFTVSDVMNPWTCLLQRWGWGWEFHDIQW